MSLECLLHFRFEGQEPPSEQNLFHDGHTRFGLFRASVCSRLQAAAACVLCVVTKSRDRVKDFRPEPFTPYLK